MTPNEVIKTLEVAKAEVEWNYTMDYAVAIDEAIEAVEKQIPKKPKQITYELLLQSGWKYECPKCRCAVGRNAFTDYKYIEVYEPWCGQCGQAIDWEAEQ